MMLEYKYGPPEGYLPVLDYVLVYLREVTFLWDVWNTHILRQINFPHVQLSELDSEETISERARVYSLLGSEGSQRSQEVSNTNKS